MFRHCDVHTSAYISLTEGSILRKVSGILIVGAGERAQGLRVPAVQLWGPEVRFEHSYNKQGVTPAPRLLGFASFQSRQQSTKTRVSGSVRGLVSHE